MSTTFKIGDSIIWPISMDKTETRKGTISKLRGDLVWIDNLHKAEDCIYIAYIYPTRVKNELLAILKIREQLTKDLNNSMKLIYELNNKISRGEL